MKFKRYHGFIQIGVFATGLVSVISWGLLIWILFGNLSNDGTEKNKILVLLFLAFAPLYGSWSMFSYVRSMAREHGGYFMDEIEMNSEGIRLYGRKTEEVFLPWDNVVEILEIRRFRTPFEIVVRGTDGEINFFGNVMAESYLNRKTGLKTKQVPANWRERTDWRNK